MAAETTPLSAGDTKSLIWKLDQHILKGGMTKLSTVPLADLQAARDFIAAARSPVAAGSAGDAERGLPMDLAPRDGTMLRLLVDYRGDGGSSPLEDAEEAWTIGFNNRENTEEDRWQFAGWSWTHDYWCEGSGKPIAWAPFEKPALAAPTPASPAEQGRVEGLSMGEDAQPYKDALHELRREIDEAWAALGYHHDDYADLADAINDRWKDEAGEIDAIFAGKLSVSEQTTRLFFVEVDPGVDSDAMSQFITAATPEEAWALWMGCNPTPAEPSLVWEIRSPDLIAGGPRVLSWHGDLKPAALAQQPPAGGE